MSTPSLSAACRLCNGDGFHPDAVHDDRISPCTACNGRATRGVFAVQVVTDTGARIEKNEEFERLGPARVRALFEAIKEADKPVKKAWRGKAVAVEVVYRCDSNGQGQTVYSARVGRRPAIEALAAVA